MSNQIGWYIHPNQPKPNTIHVWYIYLHLVDLYGKCREIYQSRGSYGIWARTPPVRQVIRHQAHRNFISFNHFGSLVCIAGFGSGGEDDDGLMQMFFGV